MQVVGVDGCRAGWIAVCLVDGSFAGAARRSAFAEVVAAFPAAVAIGVDMPIGLPESGVRQADLDARGFLGVRRSSVFLTAPRTALLAGSHSDAVARCRALGVPGVSQQGFALRVKIFEVERAVEGDDDRIVEVHPEVSLKALLGRPLASKKTWNGLMDRREALAGEGIALPAELGCAGLTAADDVLDAAAAAWSANRVARGRSATIPATPPRDDRGRRMAIHY